MCLIRSMHLTASVRLIERGLSIRGGAIDLVRFKMLDDRDRACESPRMHIALPFFDENLLDSLGPWV